MAYQVNNGPVKIWLPKDIECPLFIDTRDTFLSPPILEDVIIEAHNVEFERCIWTNIMELMYGWPSVPFTSWRCTAARAAAMSLPRDLASTGKALSLATVKDEEGKRIMMKLSRPRKPTKTNPAIWHEDPEDLRKLYEYCKDDVRAEQAISESPNVYPLSRKELGVWLYDQKINSRGIPVDMESVKACTALISKWAAKLDRNIEKVTHGAATGLQVGKLKAWIESRGVVMPSLDKEAVRDALKLPNLPQDVKSVLIWRQSLSKASTAKLKAIALSVSRDNRVRGTMLYHGAGPGRWAGRRLQPQNLPRNKKGIDQDLALELIRAGDIDALVKRFGDPMSTVSQCIRALIKAPDGRKFFGGDFSKIELVILVWMVKQLDVLKMLRQGEDVYVWQAASIFDKPEWDIDELERDIGKRGVLGCGYGCGPLTFKAMVKKEADKEISEELSEKTVETYRKKFPKVTRFWCRVEEAVMRVVRTGRAERVGHIVWGMKNEYLHCTLPSGRMLSYYKPEIRKTRRPWGEIKDSITYMGMDSYSRKWKRESTYGGKLTENIVQAIARDVLAEAIVRAEKKGYKVVVHVHDEILSEVDESFGSKEEFEAVMSQVPAWAGDCPIKVEAWEGQRYKK